MLLANIIVLFYLQYAASDCVTSLKNDHSNILLIQNRKILLPYDTDGTIKVANNEVISMACPSSMVLPVNVPTVVQARCVHADEYDIGSNIFHAKQISCQKTPAPSEVLSGKCLNNQFENVNIGFQIDNYFIHQINLCFNNGLKSTLYTEAILSKKLCCCQTATKRPGFRVGHFYTGDMDDKYNKTLQIQTLSDTLSGGRSLPLYINTNNLFERGHLVAMCDFVYAAQQKMTFYLSNTAPQWKSFNQGNWKYLEAAVKRAIKSQGADFHVFTGTYGTLQLKNSFGGQSDIYLNFNPVQGTRQMPAPLYFWKVVINTDTKRALAIIGMNNIFDVLPDPCTNIISRVTWLTGGKWTSRLSGYTIACDINEFKIISGLQNQLPQFPPTTGLLL